MTTTQTNCATVKLRSGKGRRLAEGDRLPGLAAFNPAGTIAARLIDADPETEIDADWREARIGQALTRREALLNRLDG